MRWAEWEPVYRDILADFGYDRKADEDAALLLASLARDLPRPDLAALRARVEGREVVVAGPRPAALPDGIVFATDAAAWALPRAACVVTDLDGDVEAQAAANARGVPLFVHAHGDNVPALRRVVPALRGPVQPTTQAQPREGLLNAGGFTDGDRACCLAVELGAASLALAGFDLDEPWPKPGRDPATKARKLAWARRIIDALGVPVRAL
ncbi:MAG TPA: 6-hydroxymethylpterin diphosphokinase MptE-like protein [Candidatus Thermoplasmatota archaeon]|nr:6-hydroxymethylpterin diphosphokinase MptE-like protein [Candidatus Thermoplasmatota archaeon]